MNIFSYSMIIYGLTAAISFLAVGIIVTVNRIISKSEQGEESNE